MNSISPAIIQGILEYLSDTDVLKCARISTTWRRTILHVSSVARGRFSGRTALEALLLSSAWRRGEFHADHLPFDPRNPALSVDTTVGGDFLLHGAPLVRWYGTVRPVAVALVDTWSGEAPFAWRVACGRPGRFRAVLSADVLVTGDGDTLNFFATADLPQLPPDLLASRRLAVPVTSIAIVTGRKALIPSPHGGPTAASTLVSLECRVVTCDIAGELCVYTRAGALAAHHQRRSVRGRVLGLWATPAPLGPRSKEISIVVATSHGLYMTTSKLQPPIALLKAGEVPCPCVARERLGGAAAAICAWSMACASAEGGSLGPVVLATSCGLVRAVDVGLACSALRFGARDPSNGILFGGAWTYTVGERGSVPIGVAVARDSEIVAASTSGSVPIGVAVARDSEIVAASTSGSVPVGVAVARDSEIVAASTSGSVPIGVAVARDSEIVAASTEVQTGIPLPSQALSREPAGVPLPPPTNPSPRVQNGVAAPTTASASKPVITCIAVHSGLRIVVVATLGRLYFFRPSNVFPLTQFGRVLSTPPDGSGDEARDLKSTDVDRPAEVLPGSTAAVGSPKKSACKGAASRAKQPSAEANIQIGGFLGGSAASHLPSHVIDPGMASGFVMQPDADALLCAVNITPSLISGRSDHVEDVAPLISALRFGPQDGEEILIIGCSLYHPWNQCKLSPPALFSWHVPTLLEMLRRSPTVAPQPHLFHSCPTPGDATLPVTRGRDVFWAVREIVATVDSIVCQTVAYSVPTGDAEPASSDPVLKLDALERLAVALPCAGIGALHWDLIDGATHILNLAKKALTIDFLEKRPVVHPMQHSTSGITTVSEGTIVHPSHILRVRLVLLVILVLLCVLHLLTVILRWSVGIIDVSEYVWSWPWVYIGIVPIVCSYFALFPFIRTLGACFGKETYFVSILALCGMIGLDLLASVGAHSLLMATNLSSASGVSSVGVALIVFLAAWFLNLGRILWRVLITYRGVLRSDYPQLYIPGLSAKPGSAAHLGDDSDSDEAESPRDDPQKKKLTDAERTARLNRLKLRSKLRKIKEKRNLRALQTRQGGQYSDAWEGDENLDKVGTERHKARVVLARKHRGETTSDIVNRPRNESVLQSRSDDLDPDEARYPVLRAAWSIAPTAVLGIVASFIVIALVPFRCWAYLVASAFAASYDRQNFTPTFADMSSESRGQAFIGGLWFVGTCLTLTHSVLLFLLRRRGRGLCFSLGTLAHAFSAHAGCVIVCACAAFASTVYHPAAVVGFLPVVVSLVGAGLLYF